MQITTVLSNAQPRIVNKRDGSGSFTLYELFDHEGTAWVVKQDVFNQAQGWLGMTVDMVVRVEQNGQWTNRFADIVTPNLGGQVPATNAVMQAMQAAQQAGRVPPTMPQQPAQQGWQAQAGGAMVLSPPLQPNTIGGMGQPQLQDVSVFPTKKDASIARQTAAKVSAELSTSPAEFWANCVDLARYFDTGQTPQQRPTIPAEQQFAAAGTGYDNSPPPHDDDSIPF